MKKKTKPVVRFDGDNQQLVWKSPVAEVGFDTELIVPFTHEAILIKDGQALETFRPGKYVLNEDTTPFFGTLGKVDEHGAVYEVYFINTSLNLHVFWGTPTQMDLFDPMLAIPVRVGASGVFEIRVCNARKLLLKMAGTSASFTTDDLSQFFRNKIVATIKDDLATAMLERKISYYEIAANLVELSASIREKLSPLFEEYGVVLAAFYVNNVTIPDEIKSALERAYLARAKSEIAATGGPFCTKCGAAVGADALFCPKCGAKRESEGK